MAEIDEFTGLTGFINELNDHSDTPIWMRQKLETVIRRRTYPGAPFKKLSQIKNLKLTEDVQHIDLDPHEPTKFAANHYVPDEEY